MSYACQGYGKSVTVLGSVAAFGLGILELFPEGIITKLVYIVYKEIRDILVPKNNRILEVESSSTGYIAQDTRSTEIYKVSRNIDTTINDRSSEVRLENRSNINANIITPNIYKEIKVDVVSRDIRTYMVEIENRTIIINKEGDK